MTRRRVLSEDERALWESVAKQARPLHARKARVAKAEAIEPGPPAARPGVSEAVAPSRQPAKIVHPPSLAPLTRRDRSHLARGRIEIDARLDLHGMTQARAHGALLRFLQRASGDGLRFVLVVTGKGNSAAPRSERGVLRRQVPEWLSLPEFRAFVISFEEAHIGHGGAGALYVRVRRGR